jgi:hypothetical protein
MTGALEFQEVSARISRMTDAELVDMADHPQDYEDWALNLGQEELARRGLAPEHVDALRNDNTADARASAKELKAGKRKLMLRVGPLFVLLALPVFGVIRHSVAQRGSDRLAPACAQALARMAGGSSSGNVVGFAGHSLALTVAIGSVEGNTTNPGVAGTIRVWCDLDGRSMPSLTAASLGIGATREDALNEAVEQWVFESGIAIANALNQHGDVRIIGGFRVYSGPTAIRGQTPERLESLHDALFEVLAPSLLTLFSRPPPHALSITVVRRPGRDLQGEFRVDGEPSQRLQDLAMRVRWPESSGSYMLKQYYVLMPAAEAQPGR